MSKSKYENLEPIGVYYFGLFGVYVYDIIYGINDYIVAGWDDFTNTRKRKIYTDKEGNAYFNFNNCRIYLNEVERINY